MRLPVVGWKTAERYRFQLGNSDSCSASRVTNKLVDLESCRYNLILSEYKQSRSFEYKAFGDTFGCEDDVRFITTLSEWPSLGTIKI